MKNIIRQVTLDRANRRKDKSITLSFTTDLEESTDSFMEVDKLINQRGILYFKSDGDLTQAEVDEINKVEIELEGKTKSQRLRNVIYLNWKNSDQSKTKEEYYSDKMETIIEHLKSKLN